MTTRIYDPEILNAQGSLVDFNLLQRQRGGLKAYTAAAGKFPTKQRALLLRWQTSPAAGLPSEPFKVWRRPAMPLGQYYPVGYEELALPPMFRLIQFDVPLASVQLKVHSSTGGTASVAVLTGPPVLEAIVGVQSRVLVAGGSATLEFNAPLITGLALINISGFDAPTGLTADELNKVEGWELVETVGLPVAEADWAALGQRHGIKQGMVGAERPAPAAAVDRYPRGINPLGWWPVFPNAAPAPTWELPDPAKLVSESAIELLPMLHKVAALPPDQQATKRFSFTIDPPQNPAGDTMPATNPGKAELSPIVLLAMAVSTDPLLAVTLGYGTGYLDVDIPTVDLAATQLFGDPSRSDWDWMITGLWDKGLDGASAPVEYAALVPRPGMALPAPTPADFAVDFQANLRPALADQDWLASIRASWERFPFNQLSAVASFAAARHPNGTAGAAEALLQKHPLTGGYRPIGNARNAQDPEPTRQSATDGALAIPNDPGSLAMTYAVATQNIFGIWSPWAAASITVGQPELSPVQFLSADLRAMDPGSGSVCAASLECDISVDWRVRTPSRIDLRGRLFAAATRSSPPPAAPLLAGLQKSLGSAPTSVQLTFAGDVPTLAGGTVQALDAEGTAVVVPGDAAQGTSRRYRLTIPLFSLDFGATPHIGLILEARAVEAIAPHRTGPWSPTPRMAYASDPRARPTTVSAADIVQLSSLPDAAGECHVHLTWASVPGAIGYAVYESTETRILTSHPGRPEPTPDRTLSQRLTTIKEAFKENPIRRDFFRRNAELVTSTATDVTMPRGSRDIHVYTVLPVMAGGKEGPWPSGPHADLALIAYAAPRVAEPAPPTIEVLRLSDKPPAAPDYRAHIRVGTRGDAGARPKRIDLYRVRVDDAARALDSMGPPIASITANAGGWTVSAPEGGGDWIASLVGDDRPDGSWRNVWYRAVAWADDDPLRGVLKGRSLPSPAVAVMIPPAGPPDLSPLTMSWPGGDPNAVLVQFTSSAPVAATPAGPHLMSVEATLAGGAALVQRQSALYKLDTVQPATGTDIWRIDGSPTQYRLLVRRAAIGDAVSVTVRVIDPLKRVSERTLAIPSGSIVPLPLLSPIVSVDLQHAGEAYTFTTNAPDADAGGAYRLRIELTPVPVRLPIAPHQPSMSGGFGIPPVIIGSHPQPSPIKLPSQFKLVNGVYVYEAPVATVPTVSGRPSAGVSGLAVARQAAPLHDHFAIVSTVALREVLVRIITPDGRTVVQRAHG